MEQIPISFKKLEFGTNGTFQRALTELRYLKKIRGKLRKDDFSHVARKYKFPIEFLKKGLKGLSFPEDYIISQSKWFPILYRWAVYKEKAIQKLMLSLTRYYRARFSAIIVPVLILTITAYLALYVSSFTEQTFLEMMSWLLFPVCLLIIELSWESYVRIGELRRTLEEHIETMKDEGMIGTVNRVITFAKKHYGLVLVAGHKLASKPVFNLFKMGVIPKETENVPLFYAENPHLDYEKRLSIFFGLEETLEQEQ